MPTKPARNRPSIATAVLKPNVEDVNAGDVVPQSPSGQSPEIVSEAIVVDSSLIEGPKATTTMNLNIRLMSEVKRAVLVGAAQDFGPGSISGFVEDALRSLLEDYQQKLNNGQRFSPYSGEMKRGRTAK